MKSFYILDDKKRNRLNRELKMGFAHFAGMRDQTESSEDETELQRYTVTEILENPDILIDALNRLKDEQMENRHLTTELTVQSEKIAKLEPKAEYYDKVLNIVNGFSPFVIAKEYGKSALWLTNCCTILKSNTDRVKHGFFTADIWIKAIPAPRHISILMSMV